MTEPEDTNAEIWKSDSVVAQWSVEAANREATRTSHRQVMAELLPFGPDEPFTFLDLGAGTGMAARAILERHPASSAVLADFSAQMMAQTDHELAGFPGRFSRVEFDMSSSDWPAPLAGPFDAVITSMCLHHLRDERKQTLLTEIRDRLVPGGWYVNYDPVTTTDPVVEETWQRIEDLRDSGKAPKRHNRTAEEQARYENHTRYLISLDDLLGYMRGAGFDGVDVYFRDLENTICAGRSPL